MNPGCGNIGTMQGVEHYENFPVASWLCPRRLRPPIVAIYHFARTADDLADEGDASDERRLADLHAFRRELVHATQGQPLQASDGARWPEVFAPLAEQIRRHRLPPPLLHHLLDAFEQDVRHTASGHRYADHAELLDYCRRSANPVGRLLLHLYGVNDPEALAQSDAICSALQLINFWQDLGQDLARNRHYLPDNAWASHGLPVDALPHPDPQQALRAQAMLREQVDLARALMDHGAPLARRLPGRIGWELRLVVQGGLRIAERIAQANYRTWRTRPRLRATDLPILLWRGARMPRQAVAG